MFRIYEFSDSTIAYVTVYHIVRFGLGLSTVEYLTNSVSYENLKHRYDYILLKRNMFIINIILLISFIYKIKHYK